VVGNEVLSSQAPKYISQSVTRAEMYEMGMTGIYQFHGNALPKKFSTVFSVSRMSAEAPLIQAAIEMLPWLTVKPSIEPLILVSLSLKTTRLWYQVENF
jgi:hypothetical protein